MVKRKLRGCVASATLLFITLIFAVGTLAHGMSEADKQRALEAGLPDFVLLGASHMLSGYDHLLFLLGVMFFLSRFIDIVKFITAFTIGHSITLVFATLYSIQANYFLIDAVIALTVCYKGFENLDGFKRYLGTRSPNLIWMVFTFGLIHGLGLSTRLQQLPMGEGSLLMKILAFNVGVELGQIIALSVMLVVLAGWRKKLSFERFSRVVNIMLIVIGGLLLLHQLHGYQHSSYADSFPMNKDDHAHIHEDMAAESRAEGLKNYPRKLMPQKDKPSTAPHGIGNYHSH